MWLYCRVLFLERIISFLLYTIEAQNTLTIMSIPSSPTYVKLRENLTLDVTYSYTGTLGVRVDWFKGGTILVRKSANGEMASKNNRYFVEGKASLVLTNAELNDNGTFKISLSAADIFRVPHTRSVIVIVGVQPTAVINCSTIVTVLKEGQNFECLCNSTGGNPPPTASWYKDGKVVSGPGYLKNTLSLKQITGNDAGNYICVVESHDLNDAKSVEIKVLYKPQITSFNSDQKNNISPVGKTVTITCVADAFPAPNYIIFHNGLKLIDVVDGVKTIQSANLSDDGRYECVANNNFGRVSASFNLTVNVQPFAVTNCSTPLKVKEGDDVVCVCNSKGGNPPPSALWYTNGMVVNGGGHIKNMLSLKNISRNDNCTYSCVVKSLALSDATQVVIQVQYKPKIFSFKSDQENNIVNVGETVKIRCKAEGFPAPNYTIVHNCIKVTNNAVKIIKSVNIHDGGRYECVANNDLGQFSKIFNLTVNWKAASTSSDITRMHFILIAFFCGIFFGVGAVLCVLLLLRQWFKSKKDVFEPAHNYETPVTNREGAADISAYQELDLENTDRENSYQPLRMNRRRRRNNETNNETNIEDEAGYQELDKIREKDRNYQSLNPV